MSQGARTRITLVDPHALGAVRRRTAWRHHAEQAALLIFTGAAVWLINQVDPSLRLAGNVIGALIQPLWIITCLRAGQWGFVALAVFYLGVFVQGITTHL